MCGFTVSCVNKVCPWRKFCTFSLKHFCVYVACMAPILRTKVFKIVTLSKFLSYENSCENYTHRQRWFTEFTSIEPNIPCFIA